MLDSVFSSLYNSNVNAVTISAFLLIMAAALVLGAVQALVYRLNNRCTKSFAVTLATLPAVVSVVILMVNGSVGAGVAVAGTFSLVRFRSAPGTGKEIAAVFISMAIGLACGMGCVGYAALFTLILCLADTFYSRSSFGEEAGGSRRKSLQVTIPEDLEYNEIFDDLFREYTTEAKLTRVKTTNLGSLNKLSYDITLRAPGTEKALIDAIRCRNGNLEISLAEQSTEANEL